jgi:CHAT domain-containing protein
LWRVGVRSRTDILAEAQRLHGLGVAENNAGHPLRAIRLFGRARRVLDADSAGANDQRDALRARISISSSMSESELNGLDAGLRALADAQRYVDRTANEDVAVHLHLQLGFMRVRGGHFSSGLAALDAAVALIEYADPAAACNILLNRGTVFLYQGELGRAREDLTNAAERAREHGLLVEQSKARHNLGYVEFLAGNLALALQTMDEAAGLGADVSQAVIMLDRSRVLLEAGLHRESDESLVDAAELFAADRLWKDVGEAELTRAECALLSGEIPAARRLAARSRDRFRRRGNDRWRRDAELVLLQADLAAGRPGARLASPALRLAAEFRAAGLGAQARSAQLIAAEALLRANRVDQATAAAAEAGVLRPTDPISARLHARLVRATLLLAAGKRTGARTQTRAGLSELARYQAQFGSIDLQTASAVHGRRLAELDLSMAIAQGRPDAILAAVERGRATSSRLRPVRAPSDPVRAGMLAELRQVVEGIRAIESDPAAAAEANGQRRRMIEIQHSLRSRSWQVPGSGDARPPAPLSEVFDGLHQTGSALVCYLVVDSRLHALVLSRDASRIVALTSARAVEEFLRRVRADLDVLANGQLPSALATAVRASLAHSLARLDDALISPLGLPDDRLVVVPTGALATLPWGNLPSLRGRSVVIAPSATSWLAASEQHNSGLERMGKLSSAGPGSLVAMAGPELARSDQEVTAIGRHWPGATILTAANADRGQFVSAMANSTVVHVAAHGQHQAENPLFSSIRFADGPVFAYELDQSARVAEHVLLSACELGQATIRPGDEALGLTSVLLHLGTRCVISGVARVHDDIAAQVMTRYHGLLVSGVDSAQALAQACAAEDSLPAPFVCFGAAWQAQRAAVSL